MNEDNFRGYKIVEKDSVFVFEDTGENVADTWEARPCGYCGLYNTREGHDGCLGTLSGVINACCGHGKAKEAYVQFPNGSVIRGDKAIELQKTLQTQDR